MSSLKKKIDNTKKLGAIEKKEALKKEKDCLNSAKENLESANIYK